MLSCSLDLKCRWQWIKPFFSAERKFSPNHFSVCRHVPAPMGLSYSRIVNNSGQQSREGPQQESGEELADDWALRVREKQLWVSSFVHTLKNEASRAHIEILDGPRHVELVYGGDNNAGSREERQQDEEEQVDHQVSQEPAKSSHREIVPIRQERQNRLKRVTHQQPNFWGHLNKTCISVLWLRHSSVYSYVSIIWADNNLNNFIFWCQGFWKIRFAGSWRPLVLKITWQIIDLCPLSNVKMI